MGYYLGTWKRYSYIKKFEMNNITTEGSDLALELGNITKKN